VRLWLLSPCLYDTAWQPSSPVPPDPISPKSSDDTQQAQRERDALHGLIWKAATQLVHGGGVSAVGFKSYFLGILFYRFISENLCDYFNTLQRDSGEAGFDYTDFPDAYAERGREGAVSAKGFFILPSQLFENVRRRARDDRDLNQTLSSVFKSIEGSAVGTPSEDKLKGLFQDIDFNSNALGPSVAKRNEKLVELLDAIGGLPLSGDFAQSKIDLFGDAYEYLLHMYASNSGKSGGEFYTPQTVAELLARLTLVDKSEVNKVYDPACGSGSLLLQFSKLLSRDKVRQGFFGQEINHETYNLCRMNLFLHDVGFDKNHIAQGDTLLEPAHWDDEPFEAIVSNPPYSIPWVGDKDPTLINDPRFSPAGVLAPKSKADLAFTMHMLSWLDEAGTAAIVEFPGVLYRGGTERKIRHYLIEQNYIDTVIQLPPDLFFGTTIATCIIVLKKSARRDNCVLFIDASAEFSRSDNKNTLTQENRQRILDCFTAREEVPHFAKLVNNADILTNDCNLSVSSYVEQADTKEVVDIKALNADIAGIVERQSALRLQIDAIVAELEGAAA